MQTTDHIGTKDPNYCVLSASLPPLALRRRVVVERFVRSVEETDALGLPVGEHGVHGKIEFGRIPS